MTAQVAIYNGRKYKLAWQGKTKYGERAKLAFFDGSKEFWVDSSKITTTEGSASQTKSYSNRLGRRTGCSCGSREGGSQPSDCWSCKFDADDGDC